MMNRSLNLAAHVVRQNLAWLSLFTGVALICGALMFKVASPLPANFASVPGTASTTTPAVAPVPVKPPPTPNEVWEIVAPRLMQADAESRQAFQARVKEVAIFFAERKKGAVPFAETMIGYESKARVIGALCLNILDCASEIIQGGKSRAASESLENFVKDSFRTYVLTPSQVKQAIDKAVAGYFSDLKAIDSRLLVDLNADLPDHLLGIGTTSLPQFLTESRVVMGDNFVNRIVDTAFGDFFVALTLGAVASPVSGALASGVAPNGLPIIGKTATGLLANVGVEQAAGSTVAAVTGYDPQSSVVAKVNFLLDEMCDSVINGERADAERFLLFYHNQYANPDPAIREACVGPAVAMERSANLGLGLRLSKIASERHHQRLRARGAHVYGPDFVPPQAWFSFEIPPEELLTADRLKQLTR